MRSGCLRAVVVVGITQLCLKNERREKVGSRGRRRTAASYDHDSPLKIDPALSYAPGRVCVSNAGMVATEFSGRDLGYNSLRTIIRIAFLSSGLLSAICE